jgi:hypothetical protein
MVVGLFATVAVAGLAWGGYAASRMWFASPDPTPTAPPVTTAAKERKAGHPSIAAVRDKMLEQFHGKAVERFTAIPGFGMERLIPLYQEIPFEIPFFSTGDVEITGDIATPNLLKDVAAKSVADFQSGPRPRTRDVLGALTLDADAVRWAIDPGKGFGRVVRGTVVQGLQLRLLDLVGLIDPEHPQVYSGGKAIEIFRMTQFDNLGGKFAPNSGPPSVGAPSVGAPSVGAPNAGPSTVTEIPYPVLNLEKLAAGAPKTETLPEKLEIRPLDLFEVAGVAELAQGKDQFVRHKGNVVRMLGALRATAQCIECHTEHKTGDLLGAFSYTFVDTNKTLEPELKAK